MNEMDKGLRKIYWRIFDFDGSNCPEIKLMDQLCKILPGFYKR
jgi:hypothetical protein